MPQTTIRNREIAGEICITSVSARLGLVEFSFAFSMGTESGSLGPWLRGSA